MGQYIGYALVVCCQSQLVVRCRSVSQLRLRFSRSVSVGCSVLEDINNEDVNDKDVNNEDVDYKDSDDEDGCLVRLDVRLIYWSEEG